MFCLLLMQFTGSGGGGGSSVGCFVWLKKGVTAKYPYPCFAPISSLDLRNDRMW